VDQEDRVSAWGFGFSQAWGIEAQELLATERALETYYRWQLAENFSLTPDLQLVLGSGGRPTGGTHLVLGVRMNFGF
jgi:carbohydrate-selective porin OprB